ncbi:hypothetical protein C8Q80DRAFT_1266746 [Daedaleopsis nitida]|nr:hypothetical protein C8Q80DRAFT_1266746 [Daedaleopsis nitida]
MASTPWTFTIDDTSSFITYSPYGDSGSGDRTSSGWQPWFSDIGFMSEEKAALDGTGYSLRITGFPGASLAFKFYGTGVALFGNTTASYDVTVDDVTTNHQNTVGMLYTTNTLSKTMHTVTLTAHASENNWFSFDRAEVSVTDPPPQWNVFQAISTDFFQYDNNWHRTSDWQIPSKDNPMPFYGKITTAPSATFSMSFRGSGVALYGARDWGNGIYSVSLDGTSADFNSSTIWLIGNTLLFYQYGLDASTTHDLSVTAKGAQADFRFTSAVVFTPNGSSIAAVPGASSSASGLGGSPTSASLPSDAAAAVMGAMIGGLAIIAALVWWSLRRGRSRGRSTQDVASNLGVHREAAPLVGGPMVQPDSADAVSVQTGSMWCTAGSGGGEKGSRAAPASERTFHGHRPQLPLGAAPGDSSELSPSAASASAMTESAPSPSGGAGTDSSVLVERLAQSIAERINRRAVTSTLYDRDVPPPQYGA